MVVGDAAKAEAVYMTNRGNVRQPIQLQLGLHGISNGSSLQQEWVKVQRGKTMLQGILGLKTQESQQPILPATHCGCGAAWPTTSSTDSLHKTGAGGSATAAASSFDSQLVPTGHAAEPAASSDGLHQPMLQPAIGTQNGSVIGNVAAHSRAQPEVQPSHEEGTAEACVTREQSDAECFSAASPTMETRQHNASGRGTHSLPWDQLFEAMQDCVPITDDAQLPDTGMPHHVERALSPIFIQQHQMPGGAYGTRTQTIIAVWHDSHATLFERNLQTDGSWQQNKHNFVVDPE